MNSPKRHVFPLCFLIFLLIGCSTTSDDESIPIVTIVSDTVQSFITPQTNQNLVTPLGLLSHKDQLVVYDSGSVAMFVFDSDGNQLFKFGRSGEGPGEFRFIPEFWGFEDNYILFNPSSAKIIQYDTDGNYISESSIEASNLSYYMAAKSPHQFYIPTAGHQNALFEFVDLEDESAGFMIGTPVAPPSDGYDMQQVQEQVLAGQIPEMMRNQIILSSNNSGVYSFQQSNVLLQKFTHSGELEWELDLGIPATEGVYEQFLETNKAIADRGQEMVSMLQYAAKIDTTDNGVALLLNTVDSNPVTVLWIPNDGSEIQEVQFPGLESAESRPRSFTISEEESTIYFGGTMEGIVYNSEWKGGI